MSEIQNIPRKAAWGTAYLIARQAAVQGLNFTGGILLARFLSLPEYGFYGIVFYLLSFLMNFGDVGLVASLIKQQKEPTLQEYNAIFTLQLILTVIAGFMFSCVASPICAIYKLDSRFAGYFYMIALAFIVNTGRVIPAAMMERHLNFKWLSVVEIVQALVFNGTAVILAAKGYGALSFTLGLLLRSLFGAILLNVINPWKFRPLFSWPLIREHVRFGLPLQLANLLNLLKDSISPIFIGIYLGISQTALVNMASTIATLPTLVLLVINRLLLPAFSRVMGQPAVLNRLFESALWLGNSVAAVLGVFVLVMVDPIILHVFGAKWMGVKPLFYFVWTANLTFPTMMMSVGYLNAHGISKVNFYLSILWMVITLGLGMPLVVKYGIVGFGVANLMVNLTMLGLCGYVRRFTDFSIFKVLVSSWLPALPVGGLLWWVVKYLGCPGLPALIGAFLGYAVLCLIVYVLIYRKRRADLMKLLIA